MLTQVFLLHVASTLMMTGVIWMVQVLNYPAYAQVNPADFARFHRFHVQRITYVVGPLMLAEVFSGVYLFLHVPDGEWKIWTLTGIGLLAGIWISTLALQIPCHDKLSQQYDRHTHRKLVWTNWLRTILWSVRAWMCVTALLKFNVAS
jgi:hypothetical protein